LSSLLVYKLAILIINIFFESLPKAGFQKKELGVSIAFGDGNTQFLIMTDVTWNPHPPTPSPAGEGEQNPYYFLVPLSYGRGARGEGFTAFHVTPVIRITA
jgi:hypothetical protein